MNRGEEVGRLLLYSRNYCSIRMERIDYDKSDKLELGCESDKLNKERDTRINTFFFKG